MLNIRKRTAVVATVFIFWGNCPPVMAEPIVPEVVTVVSPLDSFKEAKANYDRNKSLYEKGIISRADWDKAIASFEVAKANTLPSLPTAV